MTRPTFTIALRPEPGVDGLRALKALLKTSLRRHGLRCIRVTADGPAQAKCRRSRERRAPDPIAESA